MDRKASSSSLIANARIKLNGKCRFVGIAQDKAVKLLGIRRLNGDVGGNLVQLRLRKPFRMQKRDDIDQLLIDRQLRGFVDLRIGIMRRRRSGTGQGGGHGDSYNSLWNCSN